MRGLDFNGPSAFVNVVTISSSVTSALPNNAFTLCFCRFNYRLVYTSKVGCMWRVEVPYESLFAVHWAIFSPSRMATNSRSSLSAATKFVPSSDNISLGSRLHLTIL